MAGASINSGNITATVTVTGGTITANDYSTKYEIARAALEQKKSMNIVAAEEEHIVTKCTFHNASGDQINMVESKDWHGHVVGSYPVEVGKGQSASFEHSKRPSVREGSTAAVVYRVKNANNKEYYWVFAWDNPPKTQNSKIHVYTEIREDISNDWHDEIYKNLIAAGQEDKNTQNGLTATVNITDGPVATYRAEITFDN